MDEEKTLIKKRVGEMKQNTKPLSELMKFRSPLSTSELTFENEHQYQKRVVMKEETTGHTKRVTKRKEDKVIERVNVTDKNTFRKRVYDCEKTDDGKRAVSMKKTSHIERARVSTM